jgi:hypothetical protein
MRGMTVTISKKRTLIEWLIDVAADPRVLRALIALLVALLLAAGVPLDGVLPLGRHCELSSSSLVPLAPDGL